MFRTLLARNISSVYQVGCVYYVITIKTVYWSLCTALVFWSGVDQTGIFSMGFRKTVKYKSHENSYPGSQVFACGQTGGWTYNETNSYLSQFCECA
jgi:hypothetical protein